MIVTKERVLNQHSRYIKDFDDVFNGIGYFEGIFSLQFKPDSKPYQALQICMAYALQKHFKI